MMAERLVRYRLLSRSSLMREASWARTSRVLVSSMARRGFNWQALRPLCPGAAYWGTTDGRSSAPESGVAPGRPGGAPPVELIPAQPMIRAPSGHTAATQQQGCRSRCYATVINDRATGGKIWEIECHPTALDSVQRRSIGTADLPGRESAGGSGTAQVGSRRGTDCRRRPRSVRGCRRWSSV
jgi:hypothetical protein